MAEKPILFSGPMVCAILEDRKTQTRRVVKDGQVQCPYGSPGDRPWVRETHRYWWPDWEDPGAHPCRCRYKADDSVVDLPVQWDEGDQFFTPEDAGLDQEPVKWRSPIFMPHWASRITLEITGIRVERLQSISDTDALAEGCSAADMRSGDSLASIYARLWESIHGAGSWDSNPLVWVVEFCRTQL
jgi:hypothetical protein